MTEYKIATVKFNSGAGALLCSRCNVIITDGFEHEDRFHFCEQCEPFRSKWCLDELVKEGERLGLYEGVVKDEAIRFVSEFHGVDEEDVVGLYMDEVEALVKLNLTTVKQDLIVGEKE